MTTIPNVELFATGIWKGSGGSTAVTDSDLDQIVASYTELGKTPGFQPFLKLGHAESQRFFGQRKGAPNLGFVENIRRAGNKIVGDFVNVPQALVDLIRNRRYNSVSIELYPSYEFGGKLYHNVLYAVALLGAELPAVKGLKELASSLFEDDPFEGGKGETTLFEECLMTTFTQEQLDTLVGAARTQERTAVTTQFQEQVNTLTRERDEARGERDRSQGALRTFESDQHRRECERMVDEAIKDGKLLPKQKVQALAFAMAMPGKIKFGDKEEDGAKAFADFLKSMGKAVDTSQRSAGGGNERREFSSAGDEVDQKAQTLVTEGKAKTYAEARQVILKSDPDLKVRYFNGE
jgi:hypothetical protein